MIARRGNGVGVRRGREGLMREGEEVVAGTEVVEIGIMMIGTEIVEDGVRMIIIVLVAEDDRKHHCRCRTGVHGAGGV